MTQSTDPKSTRLAAALAGGSGRPAGPRADEAFDKEVDEDLQREWLAQLWHQYSVYFVVGAVALVMAVGAYKWIEQRHKAAAESTGARYIAAIGDLTGNKLDAGTQVLAAIAKNGGGFATLARLRLAAADVATGKPADALAKYEAVANDSGIDPILSGFARLQTAMLSLDTGLTDSVQAQLLVLASDNNPWRYNAQELLGMAALKAKKTDMARAQFEPLASGQGVPPGIAERARIVMGSIVAAELAAKGTTVEGTAAKAAPAAPQGTSSAPTTEVPSSSPPKN